jgi:L-malate glycosyltransferase
VSRIKILHIIKSLGRGGAEMLLPESLKLHDQTQFEFHVIYFLPWKNQLVEAIIQAGGQVSCFKAGNNVLILLKARAIARYVKHHKIQIIHAHLPWAGFVSRIVHLITGIPVFYTEHNKQERYHFLTKGLNRFTFNWQTKALAVSDDVAESIHKNIKPVIPVIPVLNGVNTDAFQRNQQEGDALRTMHKISLDAIVVGTVAVFRFQKRLKEWLDVFKAASDKNPNLFGIIVGDGPLRNEIEEQRKLLGLEKKVLLVGLQTDVKPWYSAMNIFMMTSVFEGLPIAMLEAMSMQCTIVTTDAGGIKELIRDGVDGQVVMVEQWLDLSTVLIDLADDEQKRQALGLAARQRVVNAFSLQRMVDELEELYASKNLG